MSWVSDACAIVVVLADACVVPGVVAVGDTVILLCLGFVVVDVCCVVGCGVFGSAVDSGITFSVFSGVVNILDCSVIVCGDGVDGVVVLFFLMIVEKPSPVGTAVVLRGRPGLILSVFVALTCSGGMRCAMTSVSRCSCLAS